MYLKWYPSPSNPPVRGVGALSSDTLASRFESVVNLLTLAVQSLIPKDDVALKGNANGPSAGGSGDVRGKKSDGKVVL